MANRVAKIQEVLPRSRWKHVPSRENPADLASRGCSASHLAQSNLWWTGPHWLHDDQSSWPDTAPLEEEPLERRTNIHVLTVVKEPDNKLISVEGFNDIRKVFRIVAYVIHFVQRLQRKTRTDPLHSDKVNQDKFHVLRIDQQENFPTEYKQLKEKQSLLKKNQLQNLAPFFDPDYNVIRVGGRLSQSLYSESKKFPLLVSKNSKLVNLIIRQFHEASLHGGGQLTLNLIRQQYWITQAKPLVNNFIKHCLTCFRFNTSPPVQLMGDLPTERITPSRPFTHTGLDFAGHFWVKIAAADEIKEVKYYIAVFVCLSTNAVHLESVASLTKEDCIFALNRFIARRGMPSKILSDNGTNFLGARSDLIKIEALLNKDDKNHSIISFVTEKNCEWITFPPRAPHFGGLWEAAVKSMKRHLRRVVGTQILQLDEFQTIMAQIEAVLNSRPSCALSNDPNDPIALTTAHLLIGDNMLSMSSGSARSITMTKRYKLMKKIQDDFWKFWKRDYLTELQVRKKWFQNGPEISVGDLVLLAEDNQPPLHWKTGRVTEVYEGNDNVVRVFKVKTPTTTVIRPVVKLRKLPVEPLVNTGQSGSTSVPQNGILLKKCINT